jgi:hypothetical protein
MATTYSMTLPQQGLSKSILQRLRGVMMKPFLQLKSVQPIINDLTTYRYLSLVEEHWCYRPPLLHLHRLRATMMKPMSGRKAVILAASAPEMTPSAYIHRTGEVTVASQVGRIGKVKIHT